MLNTPPPLTVKRRIKRFAPLQLGKMLTMLYGIMGLLFVPLFLLLYVTAPQARAAENSAMLGWGIGIGFALSLPVIYAAMGFVTGVVGALIYNVIAKWLGGIEVEVE
jgi:hypothetical protein